MANDQERGGPEDLGQDPFVERLRPDPSQAPERVRILEGLLGDSDREGYKRLYFTRGLDSYAEFRAEDVVYSESIPPDQSPFLGQQATRVGIRWDATLEFTRARAPRPVDEFDLDIRLMGTERVGRRALIPESRFEPCEPCTGRLTGCGVTRIGPICDGTEIHTDCNQFTCNHGGTQIHTDCNQFTCNHEEPTEFGPRCPTRVARCPTGAFRCPRTDEPPGCI
jgi:hypothetical protein